MNPQTPAFVQQFASTSYAPTALKNEHQQQRVQDVERSMGTFQIDSHGSSSFQEAAPAGPSDHQPQPPKHISKLNINRIPNGAAKRDRKVDPSKKSGGIPDPTPKYLALASGPARPLSVPQHLLVVIDLNGTLLFRPNRKTPTKFTARPHTQRFLRYCIDTFTVVIWSSARPDNVRNMCDAILSPDMRARVAAIWGRNKFGLTPADYDLRVQCYKRLTKVWGDADIARAHPEFDRSSLNAPEWKSPWDQTNTVLVDDSLEKGRSEPFNLIEIPEFFGDANEKDGILPQVHDFLNTLSMHSNVSSYLRTTPFKANIRTNGPQ